MEASLAIGDFSRATHMSVKTLRHYHRVGLLEPADVDARSGYRRYRPEQIPTAQVIRRFRDLNMPLEHIRAVLQAPDVDTRNQVIAAHLERLEDDLAQTRLAVASLRDLLESPATARAVVHRSVPEAPAVAISETVGGSLGMPWLTAVLSELDAALAEQGLTASGPAGGIFDDELFTDEHGDATIFIPCRGPVAATGRVRAAVIPAAELAVTVHPGAIAEVDRAYGALATYVTQHTLGVEGPIREYYPVGVRDTDDESSWRTEICWPIFATRT
jgi:DNA-binding transcriptional MerR regulator